MIDMENGDMARRIWYRMARLSQEEAIHVYSIIARESVSNSCSVCAGILVKLEDGDNV